MDYIKQDVRGGIDFRDEGENAFLAQLPLAWEDFGKFKNIRSNTSSSHHWSTSIVE